MIKALTFGAFAVLLISCVWAAENRFDESMDETVRQRAIAEDSDAFCAGVYSSVDLFLVMRRDGGMSQKYAPSWILNYLSNGLDECQRRGYDPEPADAAGV